jgi:hypothetical protein
MAEWTICPHCQLKHSVRSDGLCPRCHQAVQADAAFGAAEPPPFLPAMAVALPPIQPARSGSSPVKWVIVATVAILVIFGLREMGSIPGRQMLFKLMFDLEGEPVTRVDGKALEYSLTLPPANKWFLRNEEAAHKDNADADRWLVCPDKNAHVVTIVEEVALGPDQVLDMSKLESFVIDNMRKNVQKYTVHRTSYLSRPINGRLIHGTAAIDGTDVELYHAIFINGTRVYQVLAFSEKKYFPEMRGELDQVIQTMRLPSS